MDGSEDSDNETLFPVQSKNPIGLPDSIAKAYEAAQKVKCVDPNAFGVLLGRVLDQVCIDRNASGNSLNDKLNDLANIKKEIPEKLVDVAKGLRKLRNIGAHAELGELTPEELPVMDNLCRAILEYVYSAPHIAKQAEISLKRLKNDSPNDSSDGSAAE